MYEFLNMWECETRIFYVIFAVLSAYAWNYERKGIGGNAKVEKALGWYNE